MNVHIDGHVVEVETPEDVALLVACLLPTPEQVERAKQDTLSQRSHIARELGVGFDEHGRTAGEAA